MRFAMLKGTWLAAGKRATRRAAFTGGKAPFSGIARPAATNWRQPLPVEGPGEDLGASVALGKFDTLHIGHRALAHKAAEFPCQPSYLITFSNMAEVLGWAPRLPLVAAIDHDRILEEWATEWGPEDGRAAPRELFIPFAQVRTLDPESFVWILARELRVKQITVGEGFRFGYKAAGTTDTLRALGEKLSIKVNVLELLEDEDGKISSTRVRNVLANGDMQSVQSLLGRPYRLCVDLSKAKQTASNGSLMLPPGSYLNQPPCCGAFLVRAPGADTLLQATFTNAGMLIPGLADVPGVQQPPKEGEPHVILGLDIIEKLD